MSAPLKSLTRKEPPGRSDASAKERAWRARRTMREWSASLRPQHSGAMSDSTTSQNPPPAPPPRAAGVPGPTPPTGGDDPMDRAGVAGSAEVEVGAGGCVCAGSAEVLMGAAEDVDGAASGEGGGAFEGGGAEVVWEPARWTWAASAAAIRLRTSSSRKLPFINVAPGTGSISNKSQEITRPTFLLVFLFAEGTDSSFCESLCEG
mmetsp:Transcript_34382/g.90819  ORF Transcript_34382/g.90819 Transcript_34382/m.90819 type:complete len:205 (+) Transcript_34382:90-704(+)